MSQAFSGDVETIAAKAMAKDRERRYRSPAELAADVRRYLAGQPIAARPASRWYRMRKFARRNRVLLGGALATLLAIAAGAAVAVHLALGRARACTELAHCSYVSAIAAAIAALEDDDRTLAREALLAEGVPEARKGWEWRHLWARAQPVARTVEADTPPEPWVLGHHGSAVGVLAWSPSGEVLATGTAGREIVLWDPRSYRKITGWRAHARELRSLAWSGDGSRLISTASTETIVWDLATGANLASLTISASAPETRACSSTLWPSERGKTWTVPSPGLGTVCAFSHGAGGPVLLVSPLVREDSAKPTPARPWGSGRLRRAPIAVLSEALPGPSRRWPFPRTIGASPPAAGTPVYAFGTARSWSRWRVCVDTRGTSGPWLGAPTARPWPRRRTTGPCGFGTSYPQRSTSRSAIGGASTGRMPRSWSRPFCKRARTTKGRSPGCGQTRASVRGCGAKSGGSR